MFYDQLFITDGFQATGDFSNLTRTHLAAAPCPDLSPVFSQRIIKGVLVCFATWVVSGLLARQDGQRPSITYPAFSGDVFLPIDSTLRGISIVARGIIYILYGGQWWANLDWVLTMRPGPSDSKTVSAEIPSDAYRRFATKLLLGMNIN